jgi:ribosomal protein S18 acetylase RimI-like enzyme
MIQRLEPEREAAFLHWRAGDRLEARELIGRELEAQGDGDCQIFVALHDDKIVGTVQLVYRHDDPELADGVTRGYVQALEVQPAHRRQGIGEALMRHLETAALAHGFGSVALMVEPANHAALELYRNLGYSFFKPSFWSWQGRQHETLCLQKRL